jgi:hypothetical protein
MFPESVAGRVRMESVCLRGRQKGLEGVWSLCRDKSAEERGKISLLSHHSLAIDQIFLCSFYFYCPRQSLLSIMPTLKLDLAFLYIPATDFTKDFTMELEVVWGVTSHTL